MARKSQRWAYRGTQMLSGQERDAVLKSTARMCAWAGCLNTCEGDLPRDWRWLLNWWSPQPDIKVIFTSGVCTRDAVLCGEHARQLESLLKPLGPAAQIGVTLAQV